MNRQDLARSVTNITGIPFEVADSVLRSANEVAEVALCAGERVSLRGLYSVQRVRRSATSKRSPSTGELLPVPERWGLKIEASERLLHRLNRDEPE